MQRRTAGHLTSGLFAMLWIVGGAWQVLTVDVDGVPVRPVEYGDAVLSMLTPAHPVLHDGTHGEVWMFPGEAGECVTVGMLAADFAPVIEMRYASPHGTIVAYDDEGYLGWPSSLRLQLPQTGTYFIVAGADPVKTGGEYLLALSTAPGCSPTYGQL